MPLLEVTQTKQISASIRLSESTATQVDQYAAYIQATADDVVEKALQYVFGKDPGFRDFQKTPEASKVNATLRIRKAVQPATPSQGAKKPVAAMPTPKGEGASSVAARA